MVEIMKRNSVDKVYLKIIFNIGKLSMIYSENKLWVLENKTPNN